MSEKNVPKLKERQPHIFYMDKNLKAIDPKFFTDRKAAMDEGKSKEEVEAILPNNPLITQIFEAEEKVVKIDEEISIQGLKNPMMMMYLGFSTRKIHDSVIGKKKFIEHHYFIEPDVGVFKHLIATEDISDLLSNPKNEFVIGVPVENLLEVLFKSFTKVDPGYSVTRTAKIRNLEKLNDPFLNFIAGREEMAGQMSEAIDATVHHVQLSMGCSDDQYRRWEMMFDNRDVMLNSYSMAKCFKKFSNIPAIVCGGGPSLDEFIEATKKDPNIQNNSVIIVADAVLKKLLDNGIRPHIVLRCERKKTEIFKGVTKEMTKGIYYAAYPWTPKDYFDLFEDSFYLFRSNGACMFTTIDHAKVDGGVSSGNAAIETALVLGCKNIFLTGLDCCKDDKGRTHTSGTQVEFNINNSKAKHSNIKCNDGKERVTCPVWVRTWNEYGQSIAKHMRKRQDIKVYNTATEGAVLGHTTFKPWCELGDLFTTKRNATAVFRAHRHKITDKEKARFSKTMGEALTISKEFLESLETVEGLAVDAMRTFTRETEKIIGTCQLENEGYDLVKELRKHTANYTKLLHNCVDTYDQNFKVKWYNNPFVRIFFFDVLQLDVYFYENEIASFRNKYDEVDERYFEYCKVTKMLIGKFKYYAKNLIKVLEGITNDK